MKKMDLLVTGVGGQGVVLASDIIGEAALASGLDVKKTDTLGMAQRGGSVISHVRMAPKVWSPLIKEVQVELLLAFEKLEAARWSHYLCPDGIAIINNYEQPPLSVSLGNECYPSDETIISILKQRTRCIYFVDGIKRATELGNIRAINMFMMGCLSIFTPLKINTWKDSIHKRISANFQQINITAFDEGRKEIEDVHI